MLREFFNDRVFSSLIWLMRSVAADVFSVFGDGRDPLRKSGSGGKSVSSAAQLFDKGEKHFGGIAGAGKVQVGAGEVGAVILQVIEEAWYNTPELLRVRRPSKVFEFIHRSGERRSCGGGEQYLHELVEPLTLGAVPTGTPARAPSMYGSQEMEMAALQSPPPPMCFIYEPSVSVAY